MLFIDDGGEEALDDSRSAREVGLSGSSRLIAVESGGKLVLAESLGASCSDRAFAELCGAPAMVSYGSLDLDNCNRLTERGLSCLLNLRQLREISLRGCALHKAGMGAVLVKLLQAAQLKSLDLATTALFGTLSADGATVLLALACNM
jgi:hypothetical protein